LALGGLVALVQAWMRLTNQALADAQGEPS
jgi:hypothetical protein